MEPLSKSEDRIEETLSSLASSEGAYSGLPLHFLGRLDRLLRLRYEQGGNLNDEGIRLLDWTIYSTYCDCVDLGASNAAQKLIRRFPVPSVGQPTGEA